MRTMVPRAAAFITFRQCEGLPPRDLVPNETKDGGTAKTKFWTILPPNSASGKGAKHLFLNFLQERQR